ncbi:MAG: transporter substrate-binding domain-containing protein [Pseudomonadota bacterium]
MTRLFITICCFLTAVAAHGKTLETITERGALVACLAEIDPDLVHLSADGVWSGLVVEEVAEFASHLAVDPVFVAVEWHEQFVESAGEPALLANGTCDLFAANLTRLGWREEIMTIVPLVENRMIVLAREDLDPPIQTVNDLAGRTVSVEDKSSFHMWLDEANRGRFSENPVVIHLDGEDPMEAVARGSADFAMTDADIAVLTIRTRHPHLLAVFSVGPVQEIGWGVSKSSGALQRVLATYFGEQRDSRLSAFNAIWRRYLGLTIKEFEDLVRALPQQ